VTTEKKKQQGEKTMKKLVSLLLVGILCLSALACTSQPAAETSAATAEPAAAEATAEEPAAEEAATEGFVYKKIYEYPEPTAINSQASVDNLAYVQGETPLIAYMPAGLEFSYYLAMGEGIKAAAEELGAEVVVLAPQSGSDINGQVGMMQDAITMGVDVILLNPHDDAAAAPIVDQAIAAGIAVFNINSDATDWETDLTGVIGYAQRSGNKEQGELVAEAFKDQELKIGIIEGLPGYHSTERCGGFEDGIASHTNYEIVASLNGQWNVDGGNQAGMDMLQAHPEINMIYCANDQEAMGLLQACKALGREDVTIIGNDGNTEALEAIYDGDIYSTVNTVPYEMGLYCCQAAVDVLYGEFKGGFVETPCYVTTQDNVLSFLQQPDRLNPAPSKEY